jgi:hypothetical protein
MENFEFYSPTRFVFGRGVESKVGELVKEYLAVNERATIGEMFKNIAGLPEEMTTQRLTAIVSAMVHTNEIERTMDKRVAYFALK